MRSLIPVVTAGGAAEIFWRRRTRRAWVASLVASEAREAEQRKAKRRRAGQLARKPSHAKG